MIETGRYGETVPRFFGTIVSLFATPKHWLQWEPEAKKKVLLRSRNSPKDRQNANTVPSEKRMSSNLLTLPVSFCLSPLLLFAPASVHLAFLPSPLGPSGFHLLLPQVASGIHGSPSRCGVLWPPGGAQPDPC